MSNTSFRYKYTDEELERLASVGDLLWLSLMNREVGSLINISRFRVGHYRAVMNKPKVNSRFRLVYTRVALTGGNNKGRKRKKRLKDYQGGK